MRHAVADAACGCVKRHAACGLFDSMCAECRAFYCLFCRGKRVNSTELARVAATGRCRVWLIVL